MAENTKAEPLNFSKQRDEEVQELIDALPLLIKSSYLAAKPVLNRAILKPINAYPNVFDSRVLGALENERRMDVAAAVMLDPLAVWRDFQKDKVTNETTVVEYYFGFIPDNRGPLYCLVVVRRNVLVEMQTAKEPTFLAEEIKGLQTFKAF